jgi:mycothiol system anti-sigma-R factor
MVMGDERDCTKPECVETLAEIYLFLDGELTDDKRAHIAAHLDDCQPCVGVFDFEVELRAVIARRCHEVVPEALRQRIAEVIAETES